ncbi:Hypothetical predicted protein [Paramuricea clavata]|uniref:Uncharacterized protein n=1 Tax=Paramuricea clavata TaxID=317549 RepID=A0A7D9L328_PARCT|nr:Hypothetical predicted protein [Paramuricea clavata]
MDTITKSDLRSNLQIGDLDNLSDIEVANKVNAKFLEPLQDFQPLQITVPNNDSISNVLTVSEMDVWNCLNSLNLWKSGGPDNILFWVLKENATILSLPHLKPTIFKVLDVNQYGVIPGSSTNQALIKMIHEWSEKTDGVRASLVEIPARNNEVLPNVCIIFKKENIYVKDKEKDASNYKASRFKTRLKVDCPQLVFFGPSKCTQSQLVYVEAVSAGEVLDNLPDSASNSGSDYELYNEEDNQQTNCQQQSPFQVENSTCFIPEPCKH